MAGCGGKHTDWDNDLLFDIQGIEAVIRKAIEQQIEAESIVFIKDTSVRDRCQAQVNACANFIKKKIKDSAQSENLLRNVTLKLEELEQSYRKPDATISEDEHRIRVESSKTAIELIRHAIHFSEIAQSR